MSSPGGVTSLENMQLGVNLLHDASLPDAISWWKEADSLGFDWIGVPDSPILVREVYVSCAALAMNTHRARFSPMVSNPVTRHPTVVAGALMALNELSPGRVSFGIATGDSALYGAGMTAAPLDAVASYIAAVRGLLRGEQVEWQGARFQGVWRDWEPTDEIKVYMACHGPKAIRTAASVADGVISGFGLLPENLEMVHEMVAIGARDAGRDPDGIDVWHHINVSFAPTPEEAFVHTSAGGAHFLARFGSTGKQIPVGLREAIQLLGAEDRLANHGRSNERLLEIAKEHGALDYLIQRQGGLIGPPDGLRETVTELGQRGAHNLLFFVRGPNHEAKVATTRRLGEELLANPTPPAGDPGAEPVGMATARATSDT